MKFLTYLALVGVALAEEEKPKREVPDCTDENVTEAIKKFEAAEKALKEKAGDEKLTEAAAKAEGWVNRSKYECDNARVFAGVTTITQYREKALEQAKKLKNYDSKTSEEKAEFDKMTKERDEKMDASIKEWKEKAKYTDMTQEEKDAFDAKLLADMMDKSRKTKGENDKMKMMKKKDGYDKMSDSEKKEYDAIMKKKMSKFEDDKKKDMKGNMDKRDKAGYYKMKGDEKKNFEAWEKKGKGKKEDEEESYGRKKESFDKKGGRGKMSKTGKKDFDKKEDEFRGKEKEKQDEFRGKQFDERIKEGYFKMDNENRQKFDDKQDSEFIKQMKIIEDQLKAKLGMSGDTGDMCGESKCEAGLCCGQAKLAGSTGASHKKCQDPAKKTYEIQKRNGDMEKWEFTCPEGGISTGASKLAGVAATVASMYLMMQ